MIKTIRTLKLNELDGFHEGHISVMTKGLTHLEELNIKMDAKMSQHRMKEIVREANRLSILKIDIPDFIIRVDTYKSMLTSLQNRIEHNNLHITIYCAGQLLTDSDEVLEIQNEKLIVKKLNRGINYLFPLYRWTQIDDDDDVDDAFLDFLGGLEE